jgi:hypothetical protein
MELGFLGSIARAATVRVGRPKTVPMIRPVLTARQVLPPSVLLKMPCPVAANNVVEAWGSMTKRLATISVLKVRQVPPPSVLLRIPRSVVAFDEREA